MTKSFSAETALTDQRKEKLLHNIPVYFIHKRKQDHLSGIELNFFTLIAETEQRRTTVDVAKY